MAPRDYKFEKGKIVAHEMEMISAHMVLSDTIALTAAPTFCGAGVPDYIVGRGYWTHRDIYYDPDPYREAVLYRYKAVRDKNAPGGAHFEPHMIDDHSGAGSDVLTTGLNHDGKLDIVTSTRFGTFIF
jgi:hypothetical protein